MMTSAIDYRLLPKNVCRISVELQPYQAHPIDNGMQSKKEICRFLFGADFNGCDESTLGGLCGMLRGINVFTLLEMCYYGGPSMWLMCCLAHKEFAALYILGKYKGSNRESARDVILARSVLRKKCTDYVDFWCRSTFETGVIRAVEYHNEAGQLFSPFGGSVPSFRSYVVPAAPGVDDDWSDFVEQWYDGKGNMSRRGTFIDKQGKRTVDYKLGFPCSVSAWRVDSEFDLDIDTDEFRPVYVYFVGLVYESKNGIKHQLIVNPDSKVEFNNFRDGGFHSSHPVVSRCCQFTLING